jgi:hypothetical protein
LIGELVARVPGHTGNWPLENLLTEATAAVLRRVPGLACQAMRDLSRFEPPGPVEVNTQVAIPGGFVDLELRCGDSLAVWVEVKLDARQSGDQLDTYVRERPRFAPEGAVVYLSRVGSSRAARNDVLDVRWQGFGQQLAAWLASNEGVLGAAEAWLLRDYLLYLGEKGLTMTNPLAMDHLEEVALTYRQSRDRLARLHAMVHDRVSAEGWEQLHLQDGARRTDWPASWWAVYAADPRDAYPGSDFQWAMEGFDGTGTDAPRPRICAGLIYRSETGEPSPVLALWGIVRKVRPGDNFGAFANPAAYGGYRVYRELTLDRLAGERSLGDQAELLARLALTTFDLLRDRAADVVAVQG